MSDVSDGRTQGKVAAAHPERLDATAEEAEAAKRPEGRRAERDQDPCDCRLARQGQDHGYATENGRRRIENEHYLAMRETEPQQAVVDVLPIAAEHRPAGERPPS